MVGDAVDEEVADLGGVGEGARFEAGEGSLDGAVEVEAGEESDEAGDQEDGAEAEPGLKGEVAVGHGFSLRSWGID